MGARRTAPWLSRYDLLFWLGRIVEFILAICPLLGYRGAGCSPSNRFEGLQPAPR